MKNVREIPQELTDTHCKHLYSSLARNLQVVIKQQRLGDDDNYTDDFDQRCSKINSSRQQRFAQNVDNSTPRQKECVPMMSAE